MSEMEEERGAWGDWPPSFKYTGVFPHDIPITTSPEQAAMLFPEGAPSCIMCVEDRRFGRYRLCLSIQQAAEFFAGG